MAKRGKLRVEQRASLRPTTRKNNVGNIGHPTILANTGLLRVRVKRKT